MLMKLQPPWTPELLPEVANKIIAILAQHDKPAQVLELGAGWSTLWFAGLSDVELLSLETDRDWWREVTDTLGSCRGHNAEVWQVDPQEMPPLLGDFLDESFDLVLVDCLDELRLPAVHKLKDKISKGGTLVLDDSHWPMWQAMHTTPDWPAEIIKGQHTRKTGCLHHHQTTFFTKPR